MAVVFLVTHEIFMRQLFSALCAPRNGFARPRAGLAPEAVTGAVRAAVHQHVGDQFTQQLAADAPGIPPRRIRNKAIRSRLRGGRVSEPARRTPLGQHPVGDLLADGEVVGLEAFALPDLRGPSASPLVCTGPHGPYGKGVAGPPQSRVCSPFQAYPAGGEVLAARRGAAWGMRAIAAASVAGRDAGRVNR